MPSEECAPTGSLLPAHGPWGSISGLLVDLCVYGIHFVWPNPLTNRFANIQLHPAFWSGETVALPAGRCTSTGPATACPGPGDHLDRVGREAGIYFDKSHTVADDNAYKPITLITNLVVASFNNSVRFGSIASSSLQQSNGRAFVFEGDAGMLEVDGLALPLISSGNLWAAAEASRTTMRVRGAVMDYDLVDDFTVRAGE